MKKHTTKKSFLKIILKTLFYSFLLIILLFFLVGLFSLSNNNPNQIKEEPISYVKDKIVYIIYDYSGKNQDGSYFENKITGSGVLFTQTNDKIQVFTNRHVIDCSYTQNCYQKLSEDINIRTYDGKFHKVSRVAVAPHHLDIAALEINAKEVDWYNQTFYRKTPLTIGEEVIAIGYPSFAQNVLEFSIKKGQVTDFRDLIMDDGLSFKAIDSDAYTYFGSSGGGLFDIYGNLVGINTWIQGTQNSIAIDINSINNLNDISFNTKNNLEKYTYCENGNYIYYSSKADECLPYCNRGEIMGVDFKCYKVCEDFYCESQTFNINDAKCPKDYIVGSDGYCHLPCESPSTYCVGNDFCYRNKCVSCQNTLTKLFKDGTCRFYN